MNLGPKGQTSWVCGANSTVFDGYQVQSGGASGFEQTNPALGGSFELLGENDLERFEEDYTILRIVGDVRHQFISVGQGDTIDPMGYCIRWGFFTLRTGADDTIATPMPNDLEDIGASWMWQGSSYLFNPAFTTPLNSVTLGNSVNDATEVVDINVKRKVEYGGALMLVMQWHPLAQPWVDVNVLNVAVCAHIRILVRH